MDPDSSPDLPPLKRGTYDIEAILAAAENAEFAVPPPPRSRIGQSFEPSSSFSTAFDTTITPATVAAASKKKPTTTSGTNSVATTPTSSTTSRLGARRGTVSRVSPASASNAAATTTPPSAVTPQRTDLEPSYDSRHQTPAGAGEEDMMHQAIEENGFQATASSRFQSRRTAAPGGGAGGGTTPSARLSNRSSPMLKGAGGSPYGHLEEPTPLSRALSPLNPRSRRGSIGGGSKGGGGGGGVNGATDSSFAFSSPSSSRPGSRPESRGSYALRSRDLSNDSLLSFNVMIEQQGLDDEDDTHHSGMGGGGGGGGGAGAGAGTSFSANSSAVGRLPFFLSDPEHIKLLEGEIEDPFSPNSSSLMDDHDPMLLREQLAGAGGGGGQGSLTSPLGSRRGLVRGQSPRRSQRRMLQQQLLAQQMQSQQQQQQQQQQPQPPPSQDSHRSFRSNDSDHSRGSDRMYTDANGFLSPEQGPTRHRDHSSSHNNSLYNTSYDSSPHSFIDETSGGAGNLSGIGIGNGSFSESSHPGDSSGVLSASERRKLARLERRKKLLDSIKTSADPLETVSSLAVASPTSPPESAGQDRFGRMGGIGSGGDMGDNMGLDNQFHDQPWYTSHEQGMHHPQDGYGSHHDDGSFQHSFDHSPHHSMDHHHHHGYGYEGMEDLHHSGFHLADSSPYHGPDDSHEVEEPRATSFAEWMSHSADISRLDLKSPISRSASPLGAGAGAGAGGSTGGLGATTTVGGKDGMASLNAVAAAANAAATTVATSASQVASHGGGGGGGVMVGASMLPPSTSSSSGVGNILLSPAFSSESAPITGSSPLFQSLQADSSLHPSSTPMAPSVLTSSFSPALSPDVNTQLGAANQPTPTFAPLGSPGAGGSGGSGTAAAGLYHQPQQHLGLSSAPGSSSISAAALGIGGSGGPIAAAAAGIRAMGFSTKLSPTTTMGATETSSSMTPGAAGANTVASSSLASGDERSKEASPPEDPSVLLNTVEVAFETEEQIAMNADQKPSSRSARAPATSAGAGAGAGGSTTGVADGDPKMAGLGASALPPPSSSSSNGGDGSSRGIHPMDPNKSSSSLQLEERSKTTDGEEGSGHKEGLSSTTTANTTTLSESPILASPSSKSASSIKSSESGGVGSGGSGGGSIIRRPSGLLVSARIRDSTNLDAPRYSIREMEEMKKNVRMDLRIEITNEIREEYEKTAEQEAALFQFEIQQLKTALEKEEHEKAQLKAVLDEFEASLEDIALNTTKELNTIKDENTRLTEEKEEVEKSFVLLKTRYDELISHNEKHVENERVLRSAIEALKQDYENAEARYEKVKGHAETKLSEAQVELEAMRMMYEQELAMVRTTLVQQQQQMAQQYQIEKRELEMKLEAKTRENEELIQFSEELIAKLG